MALPPGAVRATEPEALGCNGRVNVSRVALLGRDPDVVADVARVPRMNLCDGTTHVHWAEHRRVAERERIVLSARGSCCDKPDGGNSGDRKETSQLFSLRGKSEAMPRYPTCDELRKRLPALPVASDGVRPPAPAAGALPVESARFALPAALRLAGDGGSSGRGALSESPCSRVVYASAAARSLPRTLVTMGEPPPRLRAPAHREALRRGRSCRLG